MFTVEINEDQISAALAGLLRGLSDQSDLMAEIAEYWLLSSKERFAEGKSPEGTAWAPRSPVTIASYERRAKKPGYPRGWGGILHYSGQMSGNLFNGSGPDFAAVGSPEPYAAMMQFGGTRAQFPHLWGDIPARPFLGVSEEDESAIQDIVAEWFERAARAGA